MRIRFITALSIALFALLAGCAGKVYDTDPDSAWLDRAVIRIGTWLPIDWLL